MAPFSVACLLLTFVALVSTNLHCYNPSRPFPASVLRANNNVLEPTFRDIEAELQNALNSADPPFNMNVTSFAVEVTSAEKTLWGHYHTAPLLGNYTDSEPTRVNPNTSFRIASISKVFTVLAALLQEKKGHLSLRDPVTKYIPELANDRKDGKIMWEDITLESLASQLSGIPREYGQDDLTDELADHDWGFDDPVAIGLPPVHDSLTAQCGTNRQTARPCPREELIEGFKNKPQIFAPNAKPTYSNVAFVLLGVVLERFFGKSYDDLINFLIFQPVGMQGSTLKKPKDSDGIIPVMENDWGSDLGAYDPTGGLYSTPSDLSVFIRSVLSHKLLDVPMTNVWLRPHSYSSSAEFAYGMPWEIFRTTTLLPDSDRKIDLFTKSGSLSGYASRIILVPEYNVGITVLVAGDSNAVGWMEEMVLSKLSPEVESIARHQTSDRYADKYYAPAYLGINSSVEIGVDGAYGLVLKSWISNGTDFLHQYAALSKGTDAGRAQLVPSNIKRGSSGELWRVVFAAPDSKREIAIENCLVDDFDSMMYGGRSLEEFVFHEDGNGDIESVELPAFRIKLKKGETKVEMNGYKDRILGFMKPLGLF